MTTSFDRTRKLIILFARIEGPTCTTGCRLALDTGATRTVIHPAVLMTAGYDLALSHERVELTTANRIEYAVRLPVSRVLALEQTRENMPIIAHALPPSAGVDGLLGLDFFHDTRLCIDFRQGTIELD